ncbi:hypothetical protein QQX98_009302 [Neonectria punicea]|uniref:Uncharacterized protein n=1 Tax=Neonectria punicea TaxID=979145 RepID=A0ABR1GSQ8_9HYPO
MDSSGGKNAQVDEKIDLTKRILPQMTLAQRTQSLGTNAHTAAARDSAAGRFDLSGNAIITGGAGAIGLVVARAILQHGISGLALFDLNVQDSKDKIEALRKEFPAAKVLGYEIDITNENQVADGVTKTAGVLGSVDALVCFAGIVGCVHALDMPTSQWRRILDVNTTGSFLCAQAAARQMVQQGTGGRIVFTASISAHRVNFPQPQVAYNVSKAALLMLKSSLAAEWARYGITVNSISPGYMDTVLNEGDGLAEARKVWQERNPAGRMGIPEELTGAVVMLLSRAGSYINGADIVVDGGGIVF